MIREKKLTSIRLNNRLYEHLQKQAKIQNRSVNNYIETLLFESSEYFEPNEETIASIEEVQNSIKNNSGKGYSNVDDLMKDLLDE